MKITIDSFIDGYLSEDLSIAMAFYLQGFSTYSGFDNK